MMLFAAALQWAYAYALCSIISELTVVLNRPPGRLGTEDVKRTRVENLAGVELPQPPAHSGRCF